MIHTCHNLGVFDLKAFAFNMLMEVRSVMNPPLHYSYVFYIEQLEANEIRQG